jgi:hypothetical protein
MLSQETWTGVSFFVDTYVNPSPDDVAFILYTPDSREPAAWVTLALRERGVSTEVVWMSPIRADSVHVGS